LFGCPAERSSTAVRSRLLPLVILSVATCRGGGGVTTLRRGRPRPRELRGRARLQSRRKTHECQPTRRCGATTQAHFRRNCGWIFSPLRNKTWRSLCGAQKGHAEALVGENLVARAPSPARAPWKGTTSVVPKNHECQPTRRCGATTQAHFRRNGGWIFSPLCDKTWRPRCGPRADKCGDSPLGSPSPSRQGRG
jgi:hypothetical protein